MITIQSKQELEQMLAENTGMLVYYSHEKCNVCKTLKPKLVSYFNEHFPKMKLVYVNIENLPELAGQYSIFTVPVILVFFEGKETYRKARTVGVQEIAELVARPYSMIFED